MFRPQNDGCLLGEGQVSGVNRVPCTISRTDYDGAFVRIILDSAGAAHQVSLPNDGMLLDLAAGNQVVLTFAEQAAMVLRPEQQRHLAGAVA